ncbi:lysine-specific demethylase JMJ31 [Cornus florida]|uniref:lysine-specific demethylase JMJ31 n=1 Tax=Cornus florida TaxID=4283 RepID=UPI0028A2CF5F|nr:lysine-specific demethylase JMJ31 [Cornus florida]
MEESLRNRRYEKLPSIEEFARIESQNVPAVFTGCIKNWKAFSNWNPSNGGLDYLQERVGSSIVEAMLSRSAPVFYGDIRSHERVPLPFSTFIGHCKEHFQNTEGGHGLPFESESDALAGCETNQGHLHIGDGPQQIYLAQVPIMSIENEEMVQLGTLREDTQTPAFLEAKDLASINLWMNNGQTRSSTHYDPHHNILCIVSGRKQVVLWPPSASSFLYPMPLYGEASNHSSVALENPDFSIHPRAERSMEYSQKVILCAGDALFIPEGWFHQVDSDDLTIAVNFWWRSNMMSGMSEHMDAYYLRRILRRLIDKEMNHMLPETTIRFGKLEKHALEQPSNGKTDHGHNFDQNCSSDGPDGCKLKQRIMLNEMEPLALQALHQLVAAVHEHVDIADQSRAVDSNELVVGGAGQNRQNIKENLLHLEDDPVANILWTLRPLTLQNVFLAMVHNFPRTLEALISHLLSPVGAEVLTRKFEEMDQLTDEQDRNEFYQAFYGVFDDQFTAMDAILNRKESFALQAFKNVLDQYLGINIDGPRPSLR